MAPGPSDKGEFDDPIETPDGTQLNTLREAIAYLAKTVPKSERDMPAVTTAAEEVVSVQAQAKPPAGCIACQSLCDRCAKKLGVPSPHLCRGSCVSWASSRGVSQIYVRPDMSLCAVNGSYRSALCN